MRAYTKVRPASLAETPLYGAPCPWGVLDKHGQREVTAISLLSG
jgi:hypothetical protein